MKYIKLFEDNIETHLYFIPYSNKEKILISLKKIPMSKEAREDIFHYLDKRNLGEYGGFFLEIGINALGKKGGWNFARITNCDDESLDLFRRSYYPDQTYKTIKLSEEEEAAMKYNL